MKALFYLDTCIWRDYFEDRKDNFQPLGMFAFQFLKECFEKKKLILVSKIVERELLEYYSKERVTEVFANYAEIIVWVEYSKEEEIEAYSFWLKTNKKFPFSDVLHSIIARNHKVTLVTRDKHFEEIGIIKPKLPEELF
ncbi:MAG: PIN domain-containing protein [archaeon]